MNPLTLHSSITHEHLRSGSCLPAIANLPKDAIATISEFLNPCDAIRLSKTCRSLSSVVEMRANVALDRLAKQLQLTMQTLPPHLVRQPLRSEWALSGLFESSSVSVLGGHKRFLNFAGFNHDGSIAITCGSDRFARLWRMNDDGSWVRALRIPHRDGVDRADFSAGSHPHTSICITSSRDGSVQVWQQNKADQWTPQHVLEHAAAVLCHGVHTFADQQTHLLTVSRGVARIWRLFDNQAQAFELNSNNFQVLVCALSPDGKSVVGGLSDGSLNRWVLTNKGKWDHQLMALGNPVNSISLRVVAFSPDGTRVVTGGDDNNALLWQQNKAGRWESTALVGHTGMILGAEFSRAGDEILTASGDNSARVWRFEKGEWLSTPLYGKSSSRWITIAKFSPDGRDILMLGAGKLRLWRRIGSHEWQSVEDAVLKEYALPVTAADFSPDGLHLITVGVDSAARIWSRRGWMDRH